MKRSAFNVGLLGLGLVIGLSAIHGGGKSEGEKPNLALAREVLGKAKIGLMEAIATAQRKIPDGKPFLARVEMKKGTPLFGVYFVTNGKIKEVELDAADGTTVRIASSDDGDPQKPRPTLAKEVLGRARISLAEALEAAQKKVPDGKPFLARFEMRKSTLMFGVFFLADNKIKEVEFDASLGGN